MLSYCSDVINVSKSINIVGVSVYNATDMVLVALVQSVEIVQVAQDNTKGEW
jgi:hypothetical protein